VPSVCENEELQAELGRKYVDRITSEHRPMPRYMATVAISVAPMVDGQVIAHCLLDLFSIDQATGQQLDFVGQWIGCTRDIRIHLDQWFATDDKALGFDVGLWYHPYDEKYLVHHLSDDNYRRLLKAKICANQWDGTIPGMYQCWALLFEGTGYQVLIQDGLPKALLGKTRRVPFQAGINRAGNPLLRTEQLPPERPGIFAASIWDQGDSPWDVPFGPYGGQSLWDIGLRGWPGVNGNMNLRVALIGPPLDPITRILFADSCVSWGLKSAGVGVKYLIQNQPGDLGPTTVGYPLFAFNCGPEGPPPAPPPWFSFDTTEHGFDEAMWYEPEIHEHAVMAAAPAVTFPPVTLAGFNMGAWAMPWRSRDVPSDEV
jgi:hypothetical protein